MVTEFDICTETLVGKILVASDPLATLIIFIVFLASVSRLLHWAKRRQNYLFRKYHVFVMIQSIVILIGILASFFYNVAIFLRHIGMEDLAYRSLGVRILLYLATLVPPYVVSMTI